MNDGHLADRGLRNYWVQLDRLLRAARRLQQRRGCGGQVTEFKQMVRHPRRRIEVILDVVYNHTAEGNHLGPMLSLKGSTTRPTTDAGGQSPVHLDYTGTGTA